MNEAMADRKDVDMDEERRRRRGGEEDDEWLTYDLVA
jgi:hypothetical protein